MARLMVIISALTIIIACTVYNYQIGKVSNKEEKIEIIVSEGNSYLTISKILKENNLIKSEFFYKLYIKLFNVNGLKIGKYELSENMGVKKIVETLLSGSNYNPNVVSITFKEGINMRKVASLIAENTNNTEEDVIDLLNDESYINELINTYWFLTNEIKDSNIYYPLEGYLFPNTYQFNKNTSVKEIFKTMLDQMNLELTKFETDIKNSEYTVHEMLTLASVIELEAGNSDDRAGVAGVFYNRLEDNWSLGSDVTTYYASKIDDFSYSLTNKELNDCNNKYNTRCSANRGLPIGPIDNPGVESIEATIEPESNNYYYFVADCTGKTYFNINSSGHQKIIAKLISESNWCA